MCYLFASKLGNQIHIHHRKVSSPNDVAHMTEQRRKHAPHLCTSMTEQNTYSSGTVVQCTNKNKNRLKLDY